MGMEKIMDEESMEGVEILNHGTTVSTNALLERKLPTTALITNKGFRDALEIGRQNRPGIYDFHTEKPSPIVERHNRYGVPGRIGDRGGVQKTLDEDAVRKVASEISGDVESVAVSTLFSFENPEHEERIRDLLEQKIDTPISLSSEAHPEIREYERTLATVINAALKPIVDTYINDLETRLGELEADPGIRVMQSNGGVASTTVARQQPVRTILSGPAAGVAGAAYVASLRDIGDALTMDMGGTSCDVSLVHNGEPTVSTGVKVGEYPITIPMVDVHTIGAGGGSIAWVDEGGALRVGPKSSGAEPGPICYGRGGNKPTVTDAHYLLGRIDPSFVQDPAGEEEVREYFEPLADELGFTVQEAAQGILDVANSNMTRALRVVSVERGHDPRNFNLVAYGGAGPLHAPVIAHELGVPSVLIPHASGVLSALGLLTTDVSYSYSASMVREWEEVTEQDIRDVFTGFMEEARDRLQSEGFTEESMSFSRSMDLRYKGQSFELNVPVPQLDLEAISDKFHERHESRYGHAYRDEPIELVTARLDAKGLVEPPDIKLTGDGRGLDEALLGEREVYLEGEYFNTPVFDRSLFPVGTKVSGPALFEGRESTVAVYPDQVAELDRFGNIVVEDEDG